MASNNNKKNNNVNQPRRKRNKKPVKRYSEEYSNRPNPYTGYSADGNYHPEAKKHTLDEASAAKAAEENINIAEPAEITETTEKIESAEAVETVETANAADVKSEGGQDEEEPKILAENSEKSVPGSEAEASAPRRNSRRKKNSNKQASEKAKQAKNKARKAAVDKIAKGVAAHSVSEQMIDDISSMSEVIEGLAKAEKSEIEKSVNVNWDELYDLTSAEVEDETAAEDELQGESSTAAEEEPAIAKPVELGEDDVLPFDLISSAEDSDGSGESRENTDQKENVSEASEAQAFVNPPLNPSDLIPILDFDNPSQPVLDFSVPIADESNEAAKEESSEEIHTATIEEILNAVEQEKLEAVKNAQVISRSGDFAFGSDVIFDTSKSEGWDEIIPPPLDEVEENTDSTEDVSSDSVEEISRQLLETYLELEIQAAAGEVSDSEELVEEQETTFVPEEFVEEQETAFVPEELVEEQETAFVPEEFAEEQETAFVPEEFAEGQEETFVSEEFAEDESADEIESVQEEAEEEISDAAYDSEILSDVETDIEEITVSDDISPSIDLTEIEDEIFAQTDITDIEDDTPSEVLSTDETETEVQTPNQEAVKEKIEKLIEAAELAEVLRQESQDNQLDTPQVEEQKKVFNMDLQLDDSSDIADSDKIAADEEDEVKEYQPHEKVPADENVFESVLIVDDNDKAFDTAEFNNQDDTLFLHSKEASECPTAVFKLPEEPIILPTDIDDGDFQEQWLDEDEDGDEMASRSKRARRRISAFIGAVTILIALMILVSVVKTAVLGINNIGGTNEKKVEYTEFISPVVLNDPAPFETIESADNQMLLESSIWSVLDDMNDTSDYNYTYDATGKIVLSADKVEEAGKKLFGNDVQLNMDVLSEADGSAIYYYDSIDNSFHISMGGIIGPTATITKIAQKSDYISLVVGYSSQADMSLTSSEGDENGCYKYMEYILALNSDGSYYIESIRDYIEE